MFTHYNANRNKEGMSKSMQDSHTENDSKKRKVVSLKWEDEDVSSEDDGSLEGNTTYSDDEYDDVESVEHKRLRLAKQYLNHFSHDEGSRDDDRDTGGFGEFDRDISDKLREDRLRRKGVLFLDLAKCFKAMDFLSCPRSEFTGGHNSSITCLALTRDETFLYSGSKDNSVFQWKIGTGQKRCLKSRWNRKKDGDRQSGEGEILAIAVSSNGRYIACGGRDSLIRVFDRDAATVGTETVTGKARDLTGMMSSRELRGHRGAITGLAFRNEVASSSSSSSSSNIASGTVSLFSSSLDRCLKHWDINEMAYIETLFGHQDGVQAVDCMGAERPLSVSSDRTSRLWKVAEETHLVFRGHKSNVDTVQYLTDTSFISGGQDGSLHLWKDTQKNPVRSIVAAHGYEGRVPRWISSLGAVKMSNLVASGSNDGFVRLWSASAEERQLIALQAISVPGFVNDIILTPRLAAIATGREHKYGRWWNMKGGNFNKITVLHFNTTSMEDEDGDQGTDDDGDDDDDDDNNNKDNNGDTNSGGVE